MDPFEFLVERTPLSQRTRNPEKLRVWSEYVKDEAAKLWPMQAPVEISSS
jgi:hypothetical protein